MNPSAAIELEADGVPVRLTSPERVMFPELGLTKLDLASYVLSVGPGLLRALNGRPTTMERWPDGVHGGVKLATRKDPKGDAFYQKRAPKSRPDFVDTATITFPSGRTAEAVTPRNLATLVWMVNLGTLRFHAWPVTAPDTDAVDQLRLDLDPQPGNTFAHVVRAAHALRSVLGELGMTAFVKTSGGQGLHVYVRTLPTDFIAARHAAIAIGRELARRLPDLVTVSWWKEERGQRVFVDFNQMARDRLMASAYSIRPVPSARVSAPLRWEELDHVQPDDFTVATMPLRFAELGDVWADLATIEPVDLAAALVWYARDEAAGQGEMPYPPEYPKMPGEPLRVQPSRAKDRH